MVQALCTLAALFALGGIGFHNDVGGGPVGVLVLFVCLLICGVLLYYAANEDKNRIREERRRHVM